MVFDPSKVSGISDYLSEKVTIGEGDNAEEVLVYKVDSTVFLVIRKNTLELRTDKELLNLLREKYETVMESRYFGKGGVEIVDTGQLSEDEINDLVRLSYNLSKAKAESDLKTLKEEK